MKSFPPGLLDGRERETAANLPKATAAEERSHQRFAAPDRFYVLDLARGVAAFAVVIFHWVHFFNVGLVRVDFFETRQPFYHQLAFVYDHGNVAVDFFFALSGFIFYWLYSARISLGQVTAQDFAVFRLSRLYPLHLATLLMVLVLQQIYLASHGTYFVYRFNGLPQFLSNVCFATAWGLERGWSFNGPSWSISVEVLLYILFFAACRLQVKSWWQLVGLAAVGRLLTWNFEVAIGRGMTSFFLGGAVFFAYRSLLETRLFEVWARLAIAFAILAWTVTVCELHYRLVGATVPDRVLRLGFHLLVIPATVLALVLSETLWGAFAKRFAFLGDLSYSSYLIHFPLQLVVVLITDSIGFGRDVFYQPAVLVLFFATLVPISFASYHWFECPSQEGLRRLYKSRGPSPARDRKSRGLATSPREKLA